jgi:hypothetical protein
MTERELQDRVRRLCDHLGLEVQHIYDARGSWLPGWPDLTIFGTSILFAELKRQTGSASPDQRHVATTIRRAGLPWVCWRPSDLLNGEIARVLTGLSPLDIAAFTTADIERTGA